jgi:hypothetical protein
VYRGQANQGSSNVARRRGGPGNGPHLMAMSAQQPQQWTVTVAGSERHDGEKPWTYCVSASSMDDAKSRVLAHHQQIQEDDDLLIVEDECFPGAPPADVWYRWNYLPDPGESGPDQVDRELGLRDRVTRWAERRSLLEHAGSIADVAGQFRASDLEAVAIVTELAESFRRIEAMDQSATEREERLSGLGLRSLIHELVNELPLQREQQNEGSVEADDARRRRLVDFSEQDRRASSPRSADADPPML